MRARVTAGVGAWAIAAAAATAGSLLAVSYLGTEPGSAQGTAMSQDDVARALAAAPSTPAPSDPTGGTQVQDGATGTPPAASVASSAPPSSSSSPSPPGQLSTAHPPTSSRTTSVGSGPATGGRQELSGPGGEVVAVCQGANAYLVSWSPAQGFQVGWTQRGPARVAVVVFEAPARRAELHVACPAGTPVLVSAGDDDGAHEH